MLQYRIWVDCDGLRLDVSSISALQNVSSANQSRVYYCCCNAVARIAAGNTWTHLLGLSFPPCSTAVRAQHLHRLPTGVHGVLDRLKNLVNKVAYVFIIISPSTSGCNMDGLFLIKPSSKLCLLGPHGLPNWSIFSATLRKWRQICVNPSRTQLPQSKCWIGLHQHFFWRHPMKYLLAPTKKIGAKFGIKPFWEAPGCSPGAQRWNCPLISKIRINLNSWQLENADYFKLHSMDILMCSVLDAPNILLFVIASFFKTLWSIFQVDSSMKMGLSLRANS